MNNRNLYYLIFAFLANSTFAEVIEAKIYPKSLAPVFNKINTLKIKLSKPLVINEPCYKNDSEVLLELDSEGLLISEAFDLLHDAVLSSKSLDVLVNLKCSNVELPPIVTISK